MASRRDIGYSVRKSLFALRWVLEQVLQSRRNSREGNTIQTQSRVANDAEPYGSLKALFGQARP